MRKIRARKCSVTMENSIQLAYVGNNVKQRRVTGEAPVTGDLRRLDEILNSFNTNRNGIERKENMEIVVTGIGSVDDDSTDEEE